MKLAEALQERADLNRAIEQLHSRLDNNTLVQEGETPAESPSDLKHELDSSLERLAYLIARINITNCQTECDGSVADRADRRKRTRLLIKISAYRDIVSTASQLAYRARSTEIKIKPTISVVDWQNEVDRMSKELRLLDNRLQACNWTTELIE